MEGIGSDELRIRYPFFIITINEFLSSVMVVRYNDLGM